MTLKKRSPIVALADGKTRSLIVVARAERLPAPVAHLDTLQAIQHLLYRLHASLPNKDAKRSLSWRSAARNATKGPRSTCASTSETRASVSLCMLTLPSLLGRQLPSTTGEQVQTPGARLSEHLARRVP